MHDTMVTVVGNVATQVEYRETATGGMARFRIAVTPRRWDKQSNAWTNGRTSFYTVFAWRTLANNLAGSVSVGEPLLVHGRLRVREEQRDGQRRTFVDIEALAVGHDLTRGTAAFRRGGRTTTPTTPEGVGVLAGELVMAGGGGGPGTVGAPTRPDSPGDPATPGAFGSLAGSDGGATGGPGVGAGMGASGIEGAADLWEGATATRRGHPGMEPSWQRGNPAPGRPPRPSGESRHETAAEQTRLDVSAATSALLSASAPAASASAADSAAEPPF